MDLRELTLPVFPRHPFVKKHARVSELRGRMCVDYPAREYVTWLLASRISAFVRKLRWLSLDTKMNVFSCLCISEYFVAFSERTRQEGGSDGSDGGVGA